MTELALQFFGPPRASHGETPIRFDTRKALALLAFLAVTGTPQSRDVLAALLWPEADQSRARATLRRTLSSATNVGRALRVDGDEIQLDASLVWCDVVEFRSRLTTSEATDWQSADALASDSFLAGFTVRDSPTFDEWAISTAEELRAEHTELLGRLVKSEAAERSWGTALGLREAPRCPRSAERARARRPDPDLRGEWGSTTSLAALPRAGAHARPRARRPPIARNDCAA